LSADFFEDLEVDFLELEGVFFVVLVDVLELEGVFFVVLVDVLELEGVFFVVLVATFLSIFSIRLSISLSKD